MFNIFQFIRDNGVRKRHSLFEERERVSEKWWIILKYKKYKNKGHSWLWIDCLFLLFISHILIFKFFYFFWKRNDENRKTHVHIRELISRALTMQVEKHHAWPISPGIRGRNSLSLYIFFRLIFFFLLIFLKIHFFGPLNQFSAFHTQLLPRHGTGFHLFILTISLSLSYFM